MMEGIVLAALALLSVPVLLIVILVKVCGLAHAEKRSCGEYCLARCACAEGVRLAERAARTAKQPQGPARRRGAEGIRTGGKAPSPPNRSPRLGVSARCFTRTKHQRGEAERKHQRRRRESTKHQRRRRESTKH